LVDWEIVAKDLDYEGASSQMEYEAAVRMAERWCAKGRTVWMIVTDKDGKLYFLLESLVDNHV
jgi:acyl-CoA thioesterase FadM